MTQHLLLGKTRISHRPQCNYSVTSYLNKDIQKTKLRFNFFYSCILGSRAYLIPEMEDVLGVQSWTHFVYPIEIWMGIKVFQSAHWMATWAVVFSCNRSILNKNNFQTSLMEISNSNFRKTILKFQTPVGEILYIDFINHLRPCLLTSIEKWRRI